MCIVALTPVPGRHAPMNYTQQSFAKFEETSRSKLLRGSLRTGLVVVSTAVFQKQLTRFAIRPKLE